MGKHVENKGIFLDIPCVKQMRADPMPTASMIEAVVGQYLLQPEAGIYFRGRAEPVMKMNGVAVYHQHKVVDRKKSKETYVVRTIEDIDPLQPVMDLDGNIVVSVTQIPFLSYRPVLPVVALRIVEAAVKDVVESHGMADYRSTPKQPQDLYGPFIVDRIEVRDDDVLKLSHTPRYERIDNTIFAAVIDQITEIVSGIRNDVKSFCGENPWVIHFLKRSHTDLVIEKSIDWRILEYHRLTGTKLDYYE
jgi:hypothetical protein